MLDYRNAEQALRDRTAALKTERLARESAAKPWLSLDRFIEAAPPAGKAGGGTTSPVPVNRWSAFKPRDIFYVQSFVSGGDREL